MRNREHRRLLQASLVGILVAVGGSVASVVAAQDIDIAQNRTADLFVRDRAVGVRERARPDYEAVGFRQGAFTFYPKVQSDLEYNDNVFAAEVNAQDDVIFRLRPEIVGESSWSRHFLRGFARGTLNRNVDFSTEDSNEWTVGTSGRLDVVRGTNISAGGDYGEFIEPRTSSNTAIAAVEPIEFSSGQVYLAGTRTVGRLRAGVRADYRSYDYDNGRTAGGAVIVQDDRDRDVASLVGRLDYALSPASAVFGQVTTNDRSYSNVPTGFANRESSGYEVLAGVNFEVGALSRGEIAVGYISQEFDNPVYGDLDGFGARGKIEWFPTDLTTVTVSAARTIEDAGIVGAAGYLRSEAGVEIDHELLRNVILSGRVSYSDDDFNGIERADTRLTASAGGTYLVNRNLGVSLTALYLDQQSEGPSRGPNYSVTRVIASLVSQF